MAETLPVDLYGSLRNFMDMYSQRAEDVLVLEAVANALDAKAKALEISWLQKDENCYVIFSNDAPGMTEVEFEKYHRLSFSSKRKGAGIGFAGVGAKIYLAADGGSEIYTYTVLKNKGLTSKMFRYDQDIKYISSMKEKQEIELPIPKNGISNGTKYIVKLTRDNFYYLKNQIKELLLLWFNSALMLKKLHILVDGYKMQPWNPADKVVQKTIRYKKKTINCFFYDCEKVVPAEHRDITYTVYGKRIKNETIEIDAELIDSKRHKVFCVAEVPLLAESLVANKEDFHKGREIHGVFYRVKKEFHKFLESKKLLKNNPLGDSELNALNNELTRKLADLLNHKEFKFLNPWSNPTLTTVLQPNKGGDSVIDEVDGQQNISGQGEGKAHGKQNDTFAGPTGITPPGEEPGGGHTENEDGSELGQKVEKKARTLNIMNGKFPEDTREGWIDMENRVVIYNTGHPLAEKFRVDNRANLNRMKVVISTLIKNANEKKEMDASEGMVLFENLFRSIFVPT